MVNKHILKSFIIGGLLSVSLVSQAQHDPYFTHFRFNQQAYNPAAAGSKEEYICISGLTHYQYRQYNDQTFVTGTEVDPNGEVIKNVAPETYNLNANTLLNLDKKGRNKMGFGITIIDDKVGFMKTTSFKGALNYRKPIQGNFGFFSFGIEIGSTSFGYDQPKFRWIDDQDPHIPTGGGNQSQIDLGAGVLYMQKKLGPLSDFFIGASYNHLNAAKYNFSVRMANGVDAAVDMNFVRYAYFTTGADWNLPNDNWKLEPTVLVKYNPKLQLDLGMTALWAKTIRMGLGYRTAADALSILVGYERGQLQIGYSYDITMSKVRLVSDGTHEVFVKYCFPIRFPPPTSESKFRLTPRFLGRGAY